VSRSGVRDLVRVLGLATTQAESCSEGRYVISTERTATAFSRIDGPSLGITGAAIETNVAAALSTTCGKGTTVAARESSGSGTHIRIAITRTCRRGTTTASAVLLVVQLLDVSSVIISRRNPAVARSRHSAHEGSPGWGISLPRSSDVGSSGLPL
jgi:hypothetical protein